MPAAGVRGDFKALALLSRQLRQLGSTEARREFNTDCAEAARTEAMVGFRRGVDPYDKPWKPLRSRDGRPLQDTGALRNSLAGKVHVRAGGFSITTNRKGAAVHQYGATIRAKNPRYRFGPYDMVTAGKPMLVFRAGGARPRGHGRGRTGGWVQKEKVVIPQRQMVPEADVGRRWGAAIEKAADDFIKLRAGVR